MHSIRLRGAWTHNLKGLDLELSPGQLVAITGVSGSGKSSLALDTLYAEGQRRFVESFSPYARQFLERLERPPIDLLDPVAAGVAVDRKAPVKSSRSTVATMTDLEPYFSALFTREAVPTCPDCKLAAVRVDAGNAAQRALDSLSGERVIVSYPIDIGSTETFLDVREQLLATGYRRVQCAGETLDLDEVAPSKAIDKSGQVHVVVDRFKLSGRESARAVAAVEEAFRRSGGRSSVHRADFARRGPMVLSAGLCCPRCARGFEPARAGLFSYQSPVGACKTCRGFGRTITVDWNKVFPDPSRSLENGAVRPWTGTSSQHERKVLRKFCVSQGIPMDVPWAELTEAQRQAVLEGEGSFRGGRYPGVKKWFAWLETRTYKMHVRVLLSRYRAYEPCKDCGGKRLSEASLRYRVGDLDLAAWHGLEIHDARARIEQVQTTTSQGELAREEIERRLTFLSRVGLGYLTLDRQARTLSGGEAQRVSLTAALGTSLTGAMFVLDEPTVGLHATDIPPLLLSMQQLADSGNVVLVVEHDAHIIKGCDRVIALGPAAGTDGGHIVFDGSPTKWSAWCNTTAKEHRPSRQLGPATASKDRSAARSVKGSSASAVSVANGPSISVRGASEHNLRALDASFPIGRLTCVTGASGSGKSTLVEQVLFKGVARKLGLVDTGMPGYFDDLTGAEAVSSVALVDQSPLGRTSRGNAATYSGAWDRVRAIFAQAPSAKAAGWGPGHFSFNVQGGRCEACAGEGSETIEMQFLADVSLTCPSCQGRRFGPEVLAVRVGDLSIYDVLRLTVEEALKAFAREAAIVRALSPLALLGLGYLPLGQPLSTLSGGEAQRLKLARTLATIKPGTLVVLDEPSAGLHAREIGMVIDVLYALRDAGATVVLVDHDLDMIRASDWIIELGPGAGANGGRVQCVGPPSVIFKSKTRTGEALRGANDKTAHARPKRAHPTHAPEVIAVHNASEHNLKDVSVCIPRGALAVVTGPSGSGKSSLAFDVIFAEGQRRFLETLTPYARQFLPTLPRPDVSRVTGVPPSIALEQRTARAAASSTVATVTEIAQYLRLLFAKLGEPRCPDCGDLVETRTADDAWSSVEKAGLRCTVLAPAVVERKGSYLDVFSAAAAAGFARAVVDGKLVDNDDPPKLNKRKEHSIDIVIREPNDAALTRARFDTALAFGHGDIKLVPASKRSSDPTLLSTRRSCRQCDISIPELDPRWFSSNTKQGRCQLCEGSGLLDASDEVDGAAPCPECGGSRLSPVPRAVEFCGERYQSVLARDVDAALAWAQQLEFKGDRAKVAEAPHRELLRRLAFVQRVGLGYLGLDRRANTLSGGEMQRLRLSAQLGSGLTGALYVLDEPTIGLHPRDTSRLLENLRQLVDTGSTVLMVEHDAETIRAADYLIDLGPSGGKGGGWVVAHGPPSTVLADPNSPTAQALADEGAIASSGQGRGNSDQAIVIERPQHHNLRIDRVRIPCGRMTVVAGVSGSGKSTLVEGVLFPAVRRALNLTAVAPGKFSKLTLPANLSRAVAVDQRPIGRTPRSVPATFLGIWDEIRRLFASIPEAKVRGYSAGRFSFNTPKGGRCPSCEGQGAISHEMSFLPDAVTVCEACAGLRFEPETLSVRYRGHSIGDVLRLSAEDAAELFKAHRKIHAPLAIMASLGVGYLQLGQGSPTLSGGEAQRLKLASELCGTLNPKPTLYVLDEPTTGLHLADVKKLLSVFDQLVERGDSLLVIEHHPAVIASADWVIELGPEGGSGGGRLIAEGTPHELSAQDTPTGRVLASLLSVPTKRKVVSRVSARP